MEINYTEGWYIKLDRSKAQWDTINKVFSALGVNMYATDYREEGLTLEPDADDGDIVRGYELGAIVRDGAEEVDFLEAVRRLTTPVKTKRELELEELKATASKLQQQIEELENGEDDA